MNLMGYNPLTAIHIALQIKAADTLTDSKSNALTAGPLALTVRCTRKSKFDKKLKNLKKEQN